MPALLEALEDQIHRQEDSLPLRKDNRARIIWQDSIPGVTEYSFVYLHGFAGSYRDGYPVNVQVADTFGANIYLARWAGHGLKPPASLNTFTPENAWKSAKEALAIGHRIGRKVILMSTSTGGTLALKLAAVYPDSVYALINISPNIKDDQKAAFLLNSPWGWELAHLVSLGDNRKISHEKEIADQYWDTIYPAEALVNLQVLLNSTMKQETFQQVKAPVLILYYQKNFLEEDERVEVSLYPKVLAALGTPDSLKTLQALDRPGTHFLASDIKSKDYQTAQAEIIAFCREVLGMEVER